MGDKKDNLLLNEQALSEDELNKVTAGFNFSSIFSLLGSSERAGLTRPDPSD